MEGAAVLVRYSGTVKILTEAMVELEWAVDTFYDMSQRKLADIGCQVVAAGCALVGCNDLVLGEPAENLESEAYSYTGCL